MSAQKLFEQNCCQLTDFQSLQYFYELSTHIYDHHLLFFRRRRLHCSRFLLNATAISVSCPSPQATITARQCLVGKQSLLPGQHRMLGKGRLLVLDRQEGEDLWHKGRELPKHQSSPVCLR